MDVLRRVRRKAIEGTFAAIVSVLVPFAFAAGPYEPTEDPVIREAKKRLCKATDEYIKTLNYLRESKDFGFREEDSRRIADQVSKGCDGAADRFMQVLVLLKTVGMSERKSLELALDFSASAPDVQKNFLEIFTKSFLKEFFDYEFPKAMRLAFELSKDYKGNPAQARQDFLDMVQFCKDTKKMSLPLNVCSGYAVQVAKLSQYYDKGVVLEFKTVYSSLRERKDLSLDVKSALEVSYNILRHGPMAQKNFFDAFEFASKDLKYDKKKSLEFAVELASRSHIDGTPPILQVPSAGTDPQK